MVLPEQLDVMEIVLIAEAWRVEVLPGTNAAAAQTIENPSAKSKTSFLHAMHVPLIVFLTLLSLLRN